MQLLNMHDSTDPLTLKLTQLTSTLSMLLSQPELVGIITLEDVIEELIGEEIVDETDLYVDVHHRIAVARARLQYHRQSLSDPSSTTTPAERRYQRLIKRSKSTEVQASEVTYCRPLSILLSYCTMSNSKGNLFWTFNCCSSSCVLIVSSPLLLRFYLVSSGAHHLQINERTSPKRWDHLAGWEECPTQPGGWAAGPDQRGGQSTTAAQPQLDLHGLLHL